MTIKVPTPASGGLLLSYKCTAACRHCMYACSPNGYYSKCHLCTDIRKYLFDKDDFKELKPDGFYSNLE